MYGHASYPKGSKSKDRSPEYEGSAMLALGKILNLTPNWDLTCEGSYGMDILYFIKS